MLGINVTMKDIMGLFTGLSRDARDRANQVDAAAKLVKEGDKTDLPTGITEYLRKNDILVNSQTIDEFIASKSDIAPYLEKLNQKIQQAGPEGMQCDSWDDVVSYMDEQRSIKINGGLVRDYIWNLPEVGGQGGQKVNLEHMQVIRQALSSAEKLFAKDALMEVKDALASVSTCASDFVQQNQLKFSKC